MHNAYLLPLRRRANITQATSLSQVLYLYENSYEIDNCQTATMADERAEGILGTAFPLDD